VIQMTEGTHCRDTLVVRMGDLVLVPEVLPAISLYSSVLYSQRQDCWWQHDIYCRCPHLEMTEGMDVDEEEEGGGRALALALVEEIFLGSFGGLGGIRCGQPLALSFFLSKLWQVFRLFH
jgi:hypothetical protein